MLKSCFYFTHKLKICPISHIYRVVLILFLHLFYFPALAQINIFTGETMKQLQLQSGWYNNINMDLTYRSGNTDLLTLQTQYRSDYLTSIYHGFVVGSIQYGRENDSSFTDKGMVHVRSIRKLANHFMIESFGQKQFNESIHLNDRNLIGGGIRFNAFSHKSKYNLYIGIGTMWEHERIDDSELGDIINHRIRSTNYINWTLQFTEQLSTSATGYYQVHVKRLHDYRILFEGNIQLSITKVLSFPLKINFRYDNQPPTGIQKHDLEIFNGLSYNF